MSRYRNNVAKLCGLVVLSMMAAGAAQAGVVSSWDGVTPAPNDSTSWAGLGPDGTTLGATFAATSTAGNAISGSFAGSTGLVSVQCPASPSCSWTGGFPAGDTLVWAFDNTSGAGTGPLTLGFGTAVLAGGLNLQADAPGAFTAQAEAFDGGGAPLGTFSVSSDVAGDPVFIGIQDTVAEIASLSFDLTSCTGTCDVNDFAVDTLLSVNPGVTVPEPATLSLLGVGLFGLAALRRRRRS